jgi:hypothetical protein
MTGRSLSDPIITAAFFIAFPPKKISLQKISQAVGSNMCAVTADESSPARAKTLQLPNNTSFVWRVITIDAIAPSFHPDRVAVTKLKCTNILTKYE